MSSRDLVSKIKKLLARNLFLSQWIRNKIDFSEAEMLPKVLSILEKMDVLQTNFIREQLDKNPHFLKDIERNLIQEILKKMNLEEFLDRKKELNYAEFELAQTLLKS